MNEPDAIEPEPGDHSDNNTPGASTMPTDGLEPDQDKGSPHREAARYRRQLREAEAERDALVERLEAAQRRILESVIAALPTGKRLADPTDIERYGVPLDDLCDETGVISATKVAEGVAKLLAERPYLAEPSPKPPRLRPIADLSGGLDPTGSSRDEPEWRQVLSSRES